MSFWVLVNHQDCQYNIKRNFEIKSWKHNDEKYLQTKFEMFNLCFKNQHWTEKNQQIMSGNIKEQLFSIKDH